MPFASVAPVSVAPITATPTAALPYETPTVIRQAMLPAPSAFTVTASAFDTCDLAWTDNSTGEDGFEIYRSSPTNGSYSLLATTAANAVTYSDITCVAETTYYYKIRAKKGTVFSAYATEDSDTTPSALSEDITGASFALKFDEYWDNFTGITYGTSKHHTKIGYIPALDLDGTSDFCISVICSLQPAQTDTAYLFTWHGDEDNPWALDIGIFAYASVGNLILAVKPISDIAVATWTVPMLYDGLLHHVEFRGNRTTNLVSLYIDNVKIGSDVDISGSSGDDMVCKGFRVAGQFNSGTASWLDTIYEVAVGVGVTTLGSRGPGSGVSPYTYLSDATSGLVAHWKMDEASGDITDSKNSIVLADVGSPTYSVAGAGKAAALYDEVTGDKYVVGGVPTMNVVNGGAFAALDPGVTYDSNGEMHSCSSVTSTVIGTNDFTIDYWYKSSNTTAADLVPLAGFSSDGTEQYYISHQPGSNYILFQWNATSFQWTVAAATQGDGAEHHVQIKCDRDSATGLELFFDEVSKGQKDGSSKVAVDVQDQKISVGNHLTATTYKLDGTLFFISRSLSN